LSGDITPNDILKKRFSQAFRGYKPEEVADFLKLVAAEFEELLRANLLLEDKVKQLDDAIDEYRQMESTLKNTLISSQRVGQEIKEEAERKSNLILSESELEADRVIHKARQRKERLEEETFQMLNQHKRFRAEFVALMEVHGKMLKAQDSRMLLDHGINGAENNLPEPELQAESEPAAEAPHSDAQSDTEKPEVGEEEIKDLEILFPEEKE
jgi:cell division initiation protein